MGVREDIAKDVMQVSPAVATTGGFYMFGLPMTDIVAFASLLLICVQIMYRLWKWKKEKEVYEQNQRKSGDSPGSISYSPASDPEV